MYLQIVFGEDLELYYTIDNITLFVTPNVQTVKADVYSIGPDVTLLDTKVSKHKDNVFREWGAVSQFLDKWIEFVFGRDKWIKVKYGDRIK